MWATGAKLILREERLVAFRLPCCLFFLPFCPFVLFHYFCLHIFEIGEETPSFSLGVGHPPVQDGFSPLEPGLRPVQELPRRWVAFGHVSWFQVPSLPPQACCQGEMGAWGNKPLIRSCSEVCLKRSSKSLPFSKKCPRQRNLHWTGIESIEETLKTRVKKPLM